MRIAFFHHSFILGSGTDSLVYQYGRRLASKGHKVTVFHFRESDYKAERNIEQVELRFPLSRTRLGSSVLAPLLGYTGPYPKWHSWTGPLGWLGKTLNTYDIVITMMYPASYILSGLYDWPYKKKFRWIHIEWGVPENVWSNWRESLYSKLAKAGGRVPCKKAGKVLVGSSFLKEWVKENYGVESKFIYLDGIDFGCFDKSKVDNKWDAKNILYVGRVSPHKNLETLIKAFSLVRENIPDASLTLVGRQDFTKYYGKLALLSYRLGLGGADIFEGPVAWNELPKYYANCSVYCSPSRWEGFLKSECYAFEKPFVALDKTSGRDTVQDSITGILVKDTPEDLAWSLTYLLRNTKVARDMGMEGYKWAKENLDLGTIVDNLEKECLS